MFSAVATDLTIFDKVILEGGKCFDIEMKYCAHRSTDSFRVKIIDCWSNNSDIRVVEGESGTHDSTKVSRIGWIDEYDMRRFCGAVEASGGFFEFGNNEAVIFSGKSIEGFRGLSDRYAALFEL